MKNQTRLLIQFVSDNPFGGQLEEMAVFETPDEAVQAAIPLIGDITIQTILINHGTEWMRLS